MSSWCELPSTEHDAWSQEVGINLGPNNRVFVAATQDGSLGVVLGPQRFLLLTFDIDGVERGRVEIPLEARVA